MWTRSCGLKPTWEGLLVHWQIFTIYKTNRCVIIWSCSGYQITWKSNFYLYDWPNTRWFSGVSSFQKIISMSCMIVMRIETFQRFIYLFNLFNFIEWVMRMIIKKRVYLFPLQILDTCRVFFSLVYFSARGFCLFLSITLFLFWL